jgi:tripartite ATP-independent transporter DctM subunit
LGGENGGKVIDRAGGDVRPCHFAELKDRMSSHAGSNLQAGGDDSIASANRDGVALRVADRIAETMVVAALFVELLLVLANIVARGFFHHSFLWADEVARLALSMMAFVGGAVAYRRGQHAHVQLVLNLLPKYGEPFFLALSDVVVFSSAVLTGAVSIQFIAANWSERTPILQVPESIIAVPLPIGMALIAVFVAHRFWRTHGKMALPTAAAFFLVAGAAAATCSRWLPFFGDDAPIVVALVLFVVAILAGVPVGFVLLLATTAFLWGSGTVSLVVLPQNMVNGTGNYILLAIPFFILAGLVMERGGVSLRLIRFIQALVGHLRGGLLQVTIVSMYLISGLSGSKPADVAAVGTVMRDQLSESHGAAEGAAVLASAAIMGETVPPSIAMLIVGSITNVSVAAMFIGGVIPAAVIAVCLAALIHVRAARVGAPLLPRAPLRSVVRAGLGAVAPMLMPAFLLAGILSGIATPTEIAALAVVYGLFLAMVIYREMGIERFVRTVSDAASLTGVLLFIFAAASAFSWTLTIAYVPQSLVELIGSTGNSASVFMIGSIALLILVGVLLEGLPSLNVLAPLLLPIAGRIGLSELHYALVLIIAMGVGGFMPLAGIGFYVCCAVMRCDVEAASRAMVPYLAVVLIGLLIIAFVPWFVLFLPNHFGFRG